MLLGGLQKFSLLDYEGFISAIVFTQGCNLKCRFCYNPMLVWPSGFQSKASQFKQKDHCPKIKESDLFEFPKSRAGKLDAVVITGGEPTIQPDLPRFTAKIKKLGYLVKLDTNGTNPEMLNYLINPAPFLKPRCKRTGHSKRCGVAKKLIDYIAMDIKGSQVKYKKITGSAVSFNKIKKSVKIIIESGLPHEFRTTIIPGLTTQADMREIGKIIKGADKWFLQKIKTDIDLIDNKLKKIKPTSNKELEEMQKIGSLYIKQCKIR
ncbi:radical SAM protein [Candidatus Parcubacteria bacterium]|nr:radical SAM protein [Candidatus Parcubacteria bacterium]